MSNVPVSPSEPTLDVAPAGTDLSAERGAHLRRFLKRQRLELSPHTRALGAHERLPIRWGKRVTQEELAEAIGISRVWYCLLECGDRVSVSTRVLDRVARALMLSSEDRATLFCLAKPEVAGDYSGEYRRYA